MKKLFLFLLVGMFMISFANALTVDYRGYSDFSCDSYESTSLGYCVPAGQQQSFMSNSVCHNALDGNFSTSWGYQNSGTVSYRWFMAINYTTANWYGDYDVDWMMKGEGSGIDFVNVTCYDGSSWVDVSTDYSQMCGGGGNFSDPININCLAQDELQMNYTSVKIGFAGTLYSLFYEGWLNISNADLIINNQTSNNESTSGNSEQFSLNMDYDSNNFDNIVVNLVYNDVDYLITDMTTNGNNVIIDKNILVPIVDSETNFTFYWDINLINTTGTFSYNSSSNNQTVLNVDVDDCSVNTVEILNYTLYDEDDQTRLSGGKIEVDVLLYSTDLSTLVTNYSQIYNNTDNATVCISDDVINDSTYSLFSIAKYSEPTHQVEYHHIQNLTLDNNTGLQNISLYDLLTSEATTFQITFKDSNFLGVEDVVIQVNRQYVSEGVFKTVEAPKTGVNGKTTASLVRDTGTYNFIVVKNGIVIATFDNQIPFCDDATIGECFINLNQLSGSGIVFDYDSELGLIYDLSYDEDTRIVSFQFTTVSGTSKNITLVATKYDQIGTTVACSTSLVSSSGTISCTIPDAIGNGTAIILISVDGTPKFQQLIDLGGDVDYGVAGYFLLLMMLLILPLLFIESKTMTVVAGVFGFVMASMFGFIQGGILNVASPVMYLMIVAGILIYKLNSEGRT